MEERNMKKLEIGFMDGFSEVDIDLFKRYQFEVMKTRARVGLWAIEEPMDEGPMPHAPRVLRATSHIREHRPAQLQGRPRGTASRSSPGVLG
jgi:hypothetical protein